MTLSGLVYIVRVNYIKSKPIVKHLVYIYILRDYSQHMLSQHMS
jgi:hypothetical protein